MTSESPLHRRRSIRLRGYDYTQNGGYFVTICTFERDHLFGEVVDCAMRLNDCGRVADECWQAIPAHFANVEVDAFMVMPNHVHGILVILEQSPVDHSSDLGPSVGARHAVPLRSEAFGKPVPESLPTIIRSFKSAVTKRINEARRTPGFPVWQRNYHEHIIRNPSELQKLREYIEANPARWAEDRYYAQTP